MSQTPNKDGNVDDGHVEGKYHKEDESDLMTLFSSDSVKMEGGNEEDSNGNGADKEGKDAMEDEGDSVVAKDSQAILGAGDAVLDFTDSVYTVLQAVVIIGYYLLLQWIVSVVIICLMVVFLFIWSRE